MKTIDEENFQCVFVNTEQKPLEIRHLGLFKYVKGFENKLEFQELCLVFYQHPDANELLKVSVYRFYDVKFPRGFEMTAQFTIDAMTGLQKVLRSE